MTLVSYTDPPRAGLAVKVDTSDRVRLLPKNALPGQTVLGPVLVLVLWYIASSLNWISPAKLPGPAIVLDSFAELAASGVLASDLLMSLQRAMIGLSLGVSLGFVLAVIAGLMRYISTRTFMPFVVYRVALGVVLLVLLGTGAIAA